LFDHRPDGPVAQLIPDEAAALENRGQQIPFRDAGTAAEKLDRGLSSPNCGLSRSPIL
jgi:hypothetical protein